MIIIGAGTGGLCLAHGLKSDGIDVEVFERDRSPTDRQQGYRLSISATGSAALRDCLPAELFDRLVANSAEPSQGVTFVDHRLNRLLAIDFPQRNREDPDAERPIARTALRRILQEGLDDITRFGKTFSAFTDGPDGSVTARFEDGSTATGDVLIGADGAASRFRAQLLPHARRVETDVIAISGKFTLNDDNRAAIPPTILRGPTPVLGPHGDFLFANAVQYPHCSGNAPSDPDRFSDEREPYVMWGFSARRKVFASVDLNKLGGEELKGVVRARMQDWHPALGRLVEMADPSTVSAFAVKTSVPIDPWTTRNVTLLGDALHNMTPFRGIGANTALRGAAVLRKALSSCVRGEQELIPALAGYEREMIAYGFDAVRTSLADMERFHAQGDLSRFRVKMALRVADWIPPLKARLRRGR
ncbi:FAD-dependent oxidoreductase [Bradyrhizobium genosp. P]|uniref:FAD-dependent oxidoreductase n=1 Tax=Bradyrhizobium genosp. P TaxID=83641 RepID=UPI003CF4F66E